MNDFERQLIAEITSLRRRVTRLEQQEFGALGTMTYAIAIQSGNYTLTATDEVVVFTATATATLPVATGSGQSYRLVCRAGTLTIDASGSETIKGSLTQTLYAGEDLIITDTATGVWE